MLPLERLKIDYSSSFHSNGDFWAQEPAKWFKHVPELCIMGDLIYEAEPASYVGDVLGAWKLSDGVNILCEGLNTVVGNAKSCEIYCVLTELKFLWIDHHPVLASQLQEIDYSPPVLL